MAESCYTLIANNEEGDVPTEQELKKTLGLRGTFDVFEWRVDGGCDGTVVSGRRVWCRIEHVASRFNTSLLWSRALMLWM
jgi:hypothetical protein